MKPCCATDASPYAKLRQPIQYRRFGVRDILRQALIPEAQSMDILERIKTILTAESATIMAIPIDGSFDHAIKTLEACSGQIVTTGMGKAGHTAKKFAAVLCSTGTPAAFIHPGEAAHGDLGLIAQGDCIVAFSTSGKTREVQEMIELSRHIGSSAVIGVTSHPDSNLRQLSDVILDMGVIEEACPFGLTPTAGIAAMSAIADALALVLMERKGITRRDYGLRHHGGYLGAKSRLDNL
jgi:arabinose-5-phosphate isomerase